MVALPRADSPQAPVETIPFRSPSSPLNTQTAMSSILSFPPVRQPDAAAPTTRRIPSAAACHSIRVRLPAGAKLDGLAARFSGWVANAPKFAVDAVPPRLWIEPVPSDADAPASRRRREAELNLALEARDGSPLRATVLRYAGGDADLILVASRMAIGASALRRMGLWLAGVREALDVTSERTRNLGTDASSADEPLDAVLRRCTFGAAFDWARTSATRAVTADVATHATDATWIGGPLPDDWQPEMLSAAIGIVLSRFDAECVPVLGVIDADDHAEADDGVHPGVAPNRVRMRMLPLAGDEAECTVGALLGTIAARWSASPVFDTAATRAVLSIAAGAAGDMAVGLLLGGTHRERGSDASRDIEYRPCLAPPFPLTVVPMLTDAGRVVLGCRYDPRRFDASMVEAFGLAVVHVYAELRHHAQAGGHARVTDIALMEPARAASIAALGTAARPLPSPLLPAQRIEQRIAELAAAQPDACAISYEGERLSYAELERLSRRLAAAMRTHGVREGDRVGVCLERSLELVPTLLAVMQAGATYVPLDPAYPEERLAYTIADVRPALVIGTSANLPATLEAPLVSVAQLREHHLSDDVDAAPLHSASPEAAAYVIYTSGSTGRPKGVVVPHRNVMDLIAATRDDFGFKPADVWTLFHSAAFDFSVWEIWGCLTTGGHLVVVPYWTSRSPDDFLQLLARKRVSVLNQTPAAFAQLQQAESRTPADLALRLVIFGGEALDARMLLPWFDRHPESACRVVNMFGITETTVHVTAETITRRHALGGSRAVGRPIPGWQVYVMDAQRRHVPPGVAGEIYVGGAGVADGYLNREELSAERFLADPQTGGRMYRSGDRGRLRADGRLEHLGRLDRQVKIRGFRIELDEIRSVLLECEGVSAAAVLVNGTGEAARIDAYVVLSRGNTAPVRRQAARMLPEHMVPSTVTAVADFPLTPNGKLDTARLPAPVRSSFATFDVAPAHATAGAAAHGAATGHDTGAGVDAVLKRIWSEVLRTEVGLDDNFFELGGNSLYAVRISVATREGGYGDLPMRELYVRQTVRGVAAYLVAMRSGGQ